MYKLVNSIVAGGEVTCVRRLADQALIPINTDNTDYQEYLAWLAEGNEPLPADPE